MKSTLVATLFAAAALVASVSAPADVRAPSDQGPQLNSAKLNGAKFNGLHLNGPGLILQGNRFNGFRINGGNLVNLDAYGTDLTLVYAESCTAPQQAREWPLSALRVSDVNVRLAKR